MAGKKIDEDLPEEGQGGMWTMDLKPSVSMSVFEWHELLKALERLMNFTNIDTRRFTALYEKIATQLAAGIQVRVGPEEEDKKPA